MGVRPIFNLAWHWLVLRKTWNVNSILNNECSKYCNVQFVVQVSNFLLLGDVACWLTFTYV